jgi:hypothetical protein
MLVIKVQIFCLILYLHCCLFAPQYVFEDLDGYERRLSKDVDGNFRDILYGTAATLDDELGSSIVSGYGLDDRAIEVRSPAETRGFFL